MNIEEIVNSTKPIIKKFASDLQQYNIKLEARSKALDIRRGGIEADKASFAVEVEAKQKKYNTKMEELDAVKGEYLKAKNILEKEKRKLTDEIMNTQKRRREIDADLLGVRENKKQSVAELDKAKASSDKYDNLLKSLHQDYLTLDEKNKQLSDRKNKVRSLELIQDKREAALNEKQLQQGQMDLELKAAHKRLKFEMKKYKLELEIGSQPE